MDEASLGLLKSGYKISENEFLNLYYEIVSYNNQENTEIFGQFQVRLTRNNKEAKLYTGQLDIKGMDYLVKYSKNLDYKIEIIKNMLLQIEMLESQDVYTTLFKLYDFYIMLTVTPFVKELQYLLTFYNIEIVFIENPILIKPFLPEELVSSEICI